MCIRLTCRTWHMCGKLLTTALVWSDWFGSTIYIIDIQHGKRFNAYALQSLIYFYCDSEQFVCDRILWRSFSIHKVYTDNVCTVTLCRLDLVQTVMFSTKSCWMYNVHNRVHTFHLMSGLLTCNKSWTVSIYMQENGKLRLFSKWIIC